MAIANTPWAPGQEYGNRMDEIVNSLGQAVAVVWVRREKPNTHPSHRNAFMPDPELTTNFRLLLKAPELLAVLREAVEVSGFSLSGPTDPRAAEDGEPVWVCRAREILAEIH